MIVTNRIKQDMTRDALYFILTNPEKKFFPIMKGCNISYNRTQDLLKELMNKKLIRKKCIVSDSSIYLITKQGIDALLELWTPIKKKENLKLFVYDYNRILEKVIQNRIKPNFNEKHRYLEFIDSIQILTTKYKKIIKNMIKNGKNN